MAASSILIASTLAIIFTSSSQATPPAELMPQLLPSEQFFFRYLDTWISMMNVTLGQIAPVGGNLEPSTDQVSATCYKHMNYLMNGGRERKPWALKIFDSMGKPGSGIMEASLSFLGFYSECVQTKAPNDLETVRHGTGSLNHDGEADATSGREARSEPVFAGRYCLANLHLPNSAINALQKLTGLSPSTLTSAQPRIGLCLPSTCTSSEIQFLATNFLDQLIVNSSLAVSTCSDGPGKLSNDTGAIAVLVLFLLFCIPIIIGTTYDCIKSQFRTRCNTSDSKTEFFHPCTTNNRSDASGSICTVQRPSLQVREQLKSIQHNFEVKSSERLNNFLLAFSLKRNCQKIFHTEPEIGSDSIDIFHGLRFFMMLWIISGHSYSFAMQWLLFRNPKTLQEAPKNLMSQVLANGTFSVDTFLFLSGLLVTKTVMTQLYKSNGRFNFLIYYLHRYIRLTPLMMVVIAFCATLLKYMSDGPTWTESIVMYDPWCKSNWWLNALYLHNFVNRETMCLSHTWYSAVDFQLYLFAPMILIPLFKKPKLGLILSFVILLSSILFTCFWTIANQLPAVPYISDIISQEKLSEYYGSIYIKPYTRLGPYVVGMVLGFYLFKSGGKFKLSKKQAIVGWTLATIGVLGTLFAMAPANAGIKPSDVFAGIYSSLSRVIWALCLSWATYASVAGRGGFVSAILSSKLWVPWSRLTYAAYIVHPVIMAIFYGSRQTTFEFSHSLMLYLSLGNLVVTYFVSLVLSILFESPIVALEKLLLPKPSHVSNLPPVTQIPGSKRPSIDMPINNNNNYATNNVKEVV